MIEKEEKEKIIKIIEDYLQCNSIQNLLLSEVTYQENNENISIPMIVSSKIICENKTVTIDYWKIVKDKKVQMNKMKKNFELIEIFKENENFVLIPIKSKKKEDDKDERIICNKIIVSCDNQLRLFVEKMEITTSTNYITFKQDSDGNSFSIHTFS